jgi:Ca2+-binding RTX toxin-like protein
MVRQRSAAVLVICATGAVALLGVRADAASPCVGAASASTRTSADGRMIYGSECSDRIVVTSPTVREVIGGAGDDVIYANPDVEVVNGGEGDDTIYGELPETETGEAIPSTAMGASLIRRTGTGPLATASLTEKHCEANVSCYGGDGSQELIGSSGNDKIFGQRGNDILKGNSGNDQLFGGVGDESLISGGAGNDLLSGGLGTDTLNGNQESDLVRGDGTTDTIEDTGESGTDTLSFATAVTPGFHGTVGVSGFPSDANSEERGVEVRLDGTGCEGGSEYEACNNEARYGGGYDNITVSGFENVIGSPFDDVIVGSGANNRIDGGGGADAIYGKGGNDELYGGADGDFLNGEEGTDTLFGQGGADNCIDGTLNECSGSAESVTQRERGKISVGLMVTSPPSSLGWVALYLTGSTGTDHMTATYSAESVSFATEGESAQFDTNAEAGCTYEATKVTCSLPKPLDAITVAGMAGNDTLTLSGFQELTTPVMLGGEGSDVLTAQNGTEDMLVDGNGSGEDTLSAGNYDDALINNEGGDVLQGGNGNDLLLSAANCDGNTLQGAASAEADGAAVNSASWAKLPEGLPGVVGDLETTEGTPAKGRAGDTLSGARNPTCGGSLIGTSSLLNIDDFEGSSGNDQFYGDSKENNMLGRLGKDELWGRGGDDRLEAAGDGTIDHGGGGAQTSKDVCVLDANEVSSFSGCEEVK